MHYFMNKKLISIYNKVKYLNFGYFILWKIMKNKILTSLMASTMIMGTFNFSVAMSNAQ